MTYSSIQMEEKARIARSLRQTHIPSYIRSMFSRLYRVVFHVPHAFRNLFIERSQKACVNSPLLCSQRVKCSQILF